jgi:hypothetical protein
MGTTDASALRDAYRKDGVVPLPAKSRVISWPMVWARHSGWAQACSWCMSTTWMPSLRHPS